MDKTVTIMDQGAEAIIMTGEINGLKVVFKYRVNKPYRHPLFDKIFRYTRTKTEAKILSQLYLNGLRVPAPILVDLDRYLIVMQYIDGVKLVYVINSLSDEKLSRYAYRLGEQVGIIHSQHIYHGDLTLGNIIIGKKDDDVYIIDFGLAGYSMDVEEYAIDIHLLRRSLTALAPEKTGYFMKEFLRGYRSTYSGNYEEVVRRVEEIRMRGRYVEERLKRKIMRERYVGEES